MKRAMKLDPVTLAVMNNRLAAIAEEMGVVLGQTGFSPNIKERHDFSCALFDGGGELVAQAAHIPVHLGSTPLSVRAAIERLELGPGDVAAVNDPFAGGTHLPDLTLVAPIFLGNERRPFAFAANRAHHADIGGMAPGSMALSTEIYQEGFRLPPVHLVRAGEPARDVLELFFANTRVREEREGDLRAQIAALNVGAERLRGLVAANGRAQVAAAMAALKDYADRLMRATLRRLRPGLYRAVDYLDDDGVGTGPIEIRVAIRIGGGRAIVDFTGSALQVRGSVNANYAITLSATFYVMKCLAAEAVPANEGLMRPIRVIAPPGSIVNALAPAAVAGGNVETSQRIVDVLLRALAAAAPDRIPGRQLRLDVEHDAGRLRLDPRAAFLVLRNDRGWRRRGPWPSRRRRSAYAHDQHAQHADRGAGSLLPDAYNRVPGASRLRRPRCGRRRRRTDSRAGVPGAGDAEPADRPAHHSALGSCRRRPRQARRELPGARGAANQTARQGQRAAADGRARAHRDSRWGRMGPRAARPHPPPLTQ